MEPQVYTAGVKSSYVILLMFDSFKNPVTPLPYEAHGAWRTGHRVNPTIGNRRRGVLPFLQIEFQVQLRILGLNLSQYPFDQLN